MAIVEAENPAMAIKKKICSQKENEKDVAISAWGHATRMGRCLEHEAHNMQ